MGATDILRRFTRVQPKSQAPDAREFVEMQLRLEQAIDALNKFSRTVVPSGLCCTAKLTAAQISKYFDSTGLGVAGQPWEGWAIRNGSNGTDDADGRFPRYSTTESGGTGGSDSSAHTHSTPAHKHLLSIGYDDGALYLRDAATTSVVYNESRQTIGGLTASAVAPGRYNYTETDGSGTTGAASASDNRPAYIHEVPVMRL